MTQPLRYPIRYGIVIFICPAWLIAIMPPQLHNNFELLFSAGILATITFIEPGTQGAAVTGIQGIGVNAPIAAAVAAATIGLARDWHMPKGIIFAIGLLSIIFASGVIPSTRFTGKTTIGLGATPNEHFSMAPIHTN